jgi:hypothetical protein
MDSAYIYGPDAVHLPPTVAPYIAWDGKPRPRAEDCGDPTCREAREKAWALADAMYQRENDLRRSFDDLEHEASLLRARIAQLTRAIEGGTAA